MEYTNKNHNSTQEKAYHNTGNIEVLKLVPADGKTVLDIGCGTGSIARVLTEKGMEVDGISLSESELSEANKYLRKGYIHDLEKGLPAKIQDEEYDCVICSHVLEHIAYPEKLLADIRRVMKKDAVLVVALPNVFYYRYRLQLLSGSFKTEESGIWDYTHLRWYSFDTAKQLFVDNGFTVQVARVSGELPFSALLKYVLPAPVRNAGYKLLSKVSRGLFGFQLLYTAKKSTP